MHACTHVCKVRQTDRQINKNIFKNHKDHKIIKIKVKYELLVLRNRTRADDDGKKGALRSSCG